MNENFSQWRSDAREWIRERGLEIWIITGIWALLTLVIYLLATGHESPRRYQDEFLFWGLAKSFAHGDGLTWRGVGIGMRSWLYPVLLAPAFWVASTVPGEYTLVHLINSLMIGATIFPGYLMARMFMDRWRALVVALLVVSVPAMNYAGVIGTENLGYPTFTAACGAILLAIARPRLRNTILAFVLIGVALLTRTQFVNLLPIFVGTLLLGAAMAPSGKRVAYLAERRSIWIGLAALGALGALAFLAQGTGAFGLYAGAFNGASVFGQQLSFWLKSFAADVYLLTAIVPVIATFALVGRKENRNDPLVGALIALAIVAAVVFVAQISWFSATNIYDWRSRHIFYERYMFYLGPIFFTGLLVAWKRVSWGAALASTAIATLVVSGFQTDAVLVPFSYDSFGLSLVGRHMELHPDVAPDIGMFLARLTFVLGLVYVASTLPSKIVQRVLYWGLVGFTFVALIASQAQTWHYARLFSTQAFSQVPKPANFIDKNTDQPVGMIITSTDDPLSYFTTEFWNDQVVRTFTTDAAPIKSPITYSPMCEFDWDKTGLILGTGCSEVPSAWYLRSDNVVMHLKDETKRVHPSPAWPTLTLMVATSPARILSFVDGRAVRTGLVNSSMTIKSFLDEPGELRIKLRGSELSTVNSIAGESTLVGAGQRRTLTVKVGASEHDRTLTVRTPSGVPAALFVTGVDVREGSGPWKSIL
ncbi:MAG: glycosyltransferase family 39 protein [Solirubrobacterales bacterium]